MNKRLGLSISSILFSTVLIALMLVSLEANANQVNTGTTTRVSVATDGTQSNGQSFEADISADERYVAFTSAASNLVSGDNNNSWDVFVHDRQAGQTGRVSVASNGDEGDGDSSAPALSANWRYVAFSSVATTLVMNDTNNLMDVFVHNRQSGQTVRVSIASDGSQSIGGTSDNPAISADGRFVVFESTATNLVAGDSNNTTDIFVHDRDTDENMIYDEPGQVNTVRLSVSSSGAQGNGAAHAGSISASGRYVVYSSSATNLVNGDNNDYLDIFLHDRDTDGNGVYDGPGQVSTIRLSNAFQGGESNGGSDLPTISADGKIVVFESFATNLISGGTAEVSKHIYAHDIQSSQMALISISSDGSQGNNWSQNADVSDDGRYVVFDSNADNLVVDDTNFSTDIFLHDQQTGQTERINIATDGSPTTYGQSIQPAISADGQATAFKSDAALVPDDTNGFGDIFVRDLDGAPPGPTADLSTAICCERDGNIDEYWPKPEIRAIFAVTVTNNGPDTAHNVTLDFTGIPTIVNTPTQGTCDPAPTEKCYFGTLALGATASVTVEQHGAPFEDQALYQGSVAVEARVSADEFDPVPGNDMGNAVVHYYICDNAHDCILATTFCELLIWGWPSQVEGSGMTGMFKNLLGSQPRGVSLWDKLQAVEFFIPHLALYFDVRDEILNTPDGALMTELYNTHGVEIFALMDSDLNIWNQGLSALEVWEPHLQALVDGKGDTSTITIGQVQAMDDFLTSLSTYGSLDLQQAIAGERVRLGNLEDYIGMTMEQAWIAVAGIDVYLPIIIK